MLGDVLERELFILSADFARASKTLGHLAAVLRRQREADSVSAVRGDGPNETDETGVAQPPLPF